MNKSTYRKTLDVQKQGVQFTVTARKNEALSRQIILNIVDGGKPFDFGNGSLTAVLYATKPDGTFVYNACTVDKNAVTYVFTQQTLVAAGEVNARLYIVATDNVETALEAIQYNAEQDSSVIQVLYSPEFVIYVEDVPSYNGAVESKNEYTALTTATAEAREAIINANAATEAATEAAKTANVAAENADKKATLAQTAATNADTNAEVAQKAATAANNAASLAETKAELADTAASNAQDITDTVTLKLENGEFNGPQGIQGPPGEPGTTDYLELLNKPIIDIDIAGITDFYFREQIPGSTKSPCFYRIVSSDNSVSQSQNVYIDENHKNEPVYEYLTVGDTFFVFDVFDNISDGYQLSAFPLIKSDSIMQFLYLCTIGDEPVQKIYYAPLSTYEQLVELTTNLNDALNDLKTQEKLDIEQLQSQTELKLSKKANKEDVPVMPEFITDNILSESEIYGLDETDGVKTRRNINVNDGSISSANANKYYSSLIPVTRKMQITAFSVKGGKSVTIQNNIAAVVYNKDGVMTSKICGETQNITSDGKAEQSYEVTKILEPSDDCAYVRLGSTHHYLLHLCQAKIFLTVEEKINAMQEQIDAQAIAVTQEVSE